MNGFCAVAPFEGVLNSELGTWLALTASAMFALYNRKNLAHWALIICFIINT